ncbi:MAG: hypothetical protein ABI836_04250 [Gemmatimonadota bacterium]
MLTPHYLIVHIPGRGRLTLSVPEGFERAFRFGRISDSALVWDAASEVWLPILVHPVVVILRESALSEAYDYEFEFQPILEPSPLLVEPATDPIEPVPIPIEPPPVTIEPAPVAEPQHPGALPLIAVGEWERHLAEFSRLVASSSAQEERRKSGRRSGGRRRESAIFFSGVAAPILDPHDKAPPAMARFRLGVLAAALVLLTAMGIGGWLWYRAPNSSPSADLTSRALTARELDSLARASAGSNTRITAPGPLADLEAALENDLRLDEAVIWQPAIDFGSAEQVVRSSRKLDAVRNSIGLYRLGAWRIRDSLSPDDPRIEPFNESERIDAVLGVMNSAVVFLDSMAGHYRVSGDLMVFERPEDAARFNAISQFADSLLQAPVELDSFPNIRAPRRMITRLLATLPSAVAASPAQP